MLQQLAWMGSSNNNKNFKQRIQIVVWILFLITASMQCIVGSTGDNINQNQAESGNKSVWI